MKLPEFLNLKRLIEQIEVQDVDAQKCLRDGEALEVLVRSPGWKLVLDEVERMANENLAALQKLRPWNPWKCQAAIIRYQETEKTMHRLQEFVLQGIQDKQSILELREKEKEEERWGMRQ